MEFTRLCNEMAIAIASVKQLLRFSVDGVIFVCKL